MGHPQDILFIRRPVKPGIGGSGKPVIVKDVVATCAGGVVLGELVVASFGGINRREASRKGHVIDKELAPIVLDLEVSNRAQTLAGGAAAHQRVELESAPPGVSG